MATRRTKGESYWPIRIMVSRLSSHASMRTRLDPAIQYLKCSYCDVDVCRIKSGHDIRIGLYDMFARSTRADFHVRLRFPSRCSCCSPPRRHAQTAPVGFLSPSKNIACQYFDYDKQNTLRCDIMEATETSPPPGRLRPRMGQGLRDEREGRRRAPLLRRHRDGPRLPVLAYGEVWQRGGFTCTSEQTGVTCFNADRRGFSLARAKQEMF